MTNIKPINFRPKAMDQVLIDLLIQTGKFKNSSDLVREAILQLAYKEYGDELKKLVSADYIEREVNRIFVRLSERIMNEQDYKDLKLKK